MFKVLILQALYSLSDDQAEFQIRDRLSFQRFLELGLYDTFLIKGLILSCDLMAIGEQFLTLAAALETWIVRGGLKF